MYSVSRYHYLDSSNNKFSIRQEFENRKKLKEKCREDGLRLSKKLKPIAEKIYEEEGLSSLFRNINLDIDLTD